MPLPQNREAAIFQAAVQLTGAERTTFLNGACLGDNALRQRLEVLLAAHDQPDNLVPTQAGEARPTIKLDLADAPDEAVGQTLGRYKLLERVGEGGCGVVYVAEQTEPVRRRVALKVIKLGMDTKQVVARFEAERQALAMMDHPNIAKVLDAGTTGQAGGPGSQISNLKSQIAEGRPYFVMELVRGIKITDYCDQANLSTKARLDLFIKVCQAIQHAHQKGIIHRDIKPSNILVTLHDGVPVPKVIDFGIAKATEGRLTDNTVYTQLHQFIGTPAYMSPEQAEMSGLDIDTRSDIYSLGVLLYELLAGSTPFDAKELMASGIDAMRKTIREKEPQRPSTRLATLGANQLTTTAKRRSADTSKLLHQLKGDLDWIVMKCLEKDRQRRYETANGVAGDLKRHLNNEPVLARPPSAFYRFQKAFRRNKIVFSAATTVLVALAVGVAFSSWHAIRADREARRAIQAEAVAQQRLLESEAISQFLTDVFQSPDPTRDGRKITVADALAAAAKKLEFTLAKEPARRVQLQATLGATYHALGLYPEAIALREKVFHYHHARYGMEHSNTLESGLMLTDTYSFAGRLDEAIKLGEELLSLNRKIRGPQHPDTLRAMYYLANSYSATPGRRSEALKLQEEVLPLIRQAFGPEHPESLLTMNDLGNSYDYADRNEEALAIREEVLSLSRKVLGAEHPQTFWAMANLSASYWKAGRKEESLKLNQEELMLCRKVLGPEHPETLSSMSRLATYYRKTERVKDAILLQESCLESRRRVSGPAHEETLAVMTDLATSYQVAGRTEEAIQVEEEALRLKRLNLPPGHPDTLASLENLALCYAKANRKSEAETMSREAADLRTKSEAPKNRPRPAASPTAPLKPK